MIEEQEETIIRLLKKGETINTIRFIAGCRWETIKEIRERLGIKRDGTKKYRDINKATWKGKNG